MIDDWYYRIDNNFCYVFAKLSSSSSPVELSTALILIISTHPPTNTHPHPPGDSSNEALLDYLES